MIGQLTLFASEGAVAICCEDGKEATTRTLEDWMEALVPDGEYVIDIGKHPLVLRPTATTAEKIPVGHRYYHYMIGPQVYSGIFVGREKEAS